MNCQNPRSINVRTEPDKAVAEAVTVLKSGGLVVVPTETVYGIIADADNPDAVARVYDSKGRPPSKPMAFLLAHADDAASLVGELPAPARKLADRYWPGPLTLVVADAVGRELGLRVPGNQVTRRLIRESGLRIYGTSANLSGGSPATTAAQAIEQIGPSLDLVLDAGPCPLAEASTVVRVTESEWEVLRPGAIDEDKIESLVNRLILFVCAGNSCRSPMAAGVCRKLLSRRLGVPEERLRNRGYTIMSAGTATLAGDAPSQGAIRAMSELGIDISAHRRRPLTRQLAERAFVVFVMDPGLLSGEENGSLAGSRVLEAARDKLRLLGRGIPDPYGCIDEHYRMCARQIWDAVSAALDIITA